MVVKLEDLKIKYVQYNNSKYDKQILNLYLSNFLTTSGLKGYQFLTCPYEEHGILKLSATLLCLFGVFWGITSIFLSFMLSILSYVILIHFLCFYYGPKLMAEQSLEWLRMSFIDNIYQRMEEYYSSEGNKLFIAIKEDDDQVIGMASYEKDIQFKIPYDVSEGVQLMRVSVSNQYQGRGIATKLLNLIEDQAKKDNQKFIFLAAMKTNTPALRMYQKYGYHSLDVEYERSILMKIIGIRKSLMIKQI